MKTEKQLTAVEWYSNKLVEILGDMCNEFTQEQTLANHYALKQAKEMEKEQMIEFAKKWGLTIEERELSYTERYDIHKEYITEDKLDLLFEFATNENLDKLGVPTKLITITYNNKTIESYE
jgi:hypothetical protein